VGVEKKHPGHFWIDTNNQVYTFGMVDHQHSEIIEIHAELKEIFWTSMVVDIYHIQNLSH